MEGNLNALSELDASKYVWHLLWKQNQSSHAECKILDVILLSKSKENGVCGWLFTSNDGIVKNKLKTRWNFHGIMERVRTNRDGNSDPNNM
jgi:hypothetical protein